MAKHDDSQPDSSNQATTLSKQDERALASALSDLAAALRQRSESAAHHPRNEDAAFAAKEYREIKGALRTFLEKPSTGYYPSKPTGA